MPINSEIIQKKEFHIIFKGYKPEEVDKFLDMLSTEFDKINQQNKELQEQIDKLKYERGSESEDMKKVLQDALVSAHKVAEDIKRKAELEAKEIYSQKKIESENEFKELELKKSSLKESIANMKEQYLGLKKYFDEASRELEQVLQLENEEFEMSATEEPAESIDEELDKDEAVDNEEALNSQDQQEPAEQDTEEGQDEQENNSSDEQERDEQKKPDETEENDDDEEAQEEDDFNIDKKKRDDIANPDIINDFFKSDE